MVAYRDVMTDHTIGPDDPISWRAITYDTPVVTADGTRAGVVREVLGSDAEDIFHGIRVDLAKGHKNVLLLADDVASMTKASVTTGLTEGQMEALPEYDEQADYHLSTVGRFQKHLGWRRDSKSDEEAG
jgi:hypothetical protein